MPIGSRSPATASSSPTSLDASWPITASTWILIHKQPADAAVLGEALKFFAWSYSKGQESAKALDFIPMPASVVTDIEKMWAADIKDSSGKPVYGLTH